MTMRAVPAALVLCALAIGNNARAAVYAVGPGQPLADCGQVPWESLAPGDSVLIHARPAPYTNKWVICRTGTAAQPIVVRGVPDAGGALPVIDGAGATTRLALNFWNEDRGVIKIGGANSPPDLMPAWIVIESLDIRGARSTNTFTGRSGTGPYAANASAVYIEKGQHIAIRGCHLHDCGNGFFCAWQTTDLRLEANWIEDNGNVGSIYEHNNYTEALGIVFQYNHFGPLRTGAGGNSLKDRSAGTVIRYNWIEGGNRQLDLVDSDYSELYDDPSYRNTFVYGNVLIEPDGDGNSQIAHYGGDSGVLAQYRQGTLYFFHNTMISRRSGNTTLLRLSSAGETADVRNNVLYVTAPGNRLALLDEEGTLVATQNWMKTGWVDSHSGAAVDVTDAGQVTGADPAFSDYAGEDFTPAAGSPCLDVAAALPPAVLPDHRPVKEYVKHQASRARADDGAPDLGAFERGSATGVPETGPPPFPGRLTASPSPFAAAVRIERSGGPAPRAGALLVIVDAAGRRVALLAADAAGAWTWAPERGIPPGIYFARGAGARARLVYVR